MLGHAAPLGLFYLKVCKEHKHNPQSKKSHHKSGERKSFVVHHWEGKKTKIKQIIVVVTYHSIITETNKTLEVFPIMYNATSLNIPIRIEHKTEKFTKKYVLNCIWSVALRSQNQ